MPMRVSSPTVQPWTMAPWPMVQFFPTVVWECRMAASWMLVFSPTWMAPSSPRTTAWNQTLTPFSSVTSPTTTAVSAMKTFSSLFLR